MPLLLLLYQVSRIYPLNFKDCNKRWSNVSPAVSHISTVCRIIKYICRDCRVYDRMGRADAGLGTELREMAEIIWARATPPHVTHHTALLHCTRHSEDTLLQGRDETPRFVTGIRWLYTVPWWCPEYENVRYLNMFNVLLTFLLIMMPWIFYLKAFVYNWRNERKMKVYELKL